MMQFVPVHGDPHDVQVTQWVRRGARSSPGELITNVGGWGFTSRRRRWIVSSYNYVIPISGQAVGGFRWVLRFAPPPSGTLNLNKIGSKLCNK